jgi:hypothetical protein
MKGGCGVTFLPPAGGSGRKGASVHVIYLKKAKKEVEKSTQVV